MLYLPSLDASLISVSIKVGRMQIGPYTPTVSSFACASLVCRSYAYTRPRLMTRMPHIITMCGKVIPADCLGNGNHICIMFCCARYQYNIQRDTYFVVGGVGVISAHRKHRRGGRGGLSIDFGSWL